MILPVLVTFADADAFQDQLLFVSAPQTSLSHRRQDPNPIVAEIAEIHSA